MTIKSKIFNYGNEHEADWPPKFIETPRGLVGYFDKETLTFKEGYPPNPNNNFGTPPSVIFDSIKPTYHEAAQRVVDSREEWNRLDEEHGCLTFGSIKESRRVADKAAKDAARALKNDRRKASEEALKMVRANPREINQKLNKQAEKQLEIANKSGLDKLITEQAERPLRQQGIKI